MMSSHVPEVLRLESLWSFQGYLFLSEFRFVASLYLHRYPDMDESGCGVVLLLGWLMPEILILPKPSRAVSEHVRFAVLPESVRTCEGPEFPSIPPVPNNWSTNVSPKPKASTAPASLIS